MLRERDVREARRGLNETGACIRHRLAKVGWSGTPSFEPGSAICVRASMSPALLADR